MAFLIVLLSALAATAFAQDAPQAAAPTGGQKTGTNCGALGANGATVESGFVYYLCQDGQLFPKGCVTLDKKRVDIGQTVDYRQSRLSCDMKGVLPGLTVKACVLGGQEHPIGSTFNDDKYTYTCEQATNEAKITQIGCSDGGKAVKYDEKVTKEDGVYVCDKNYRKLVKAGCVKDGKQFNIGDSFDAGDMWFNCTRGGPKASGCINDGKRLNDGDRFFKNDIIYECFIENEKIDLRVAGCVQRDGGNTVERRLGCFWTEGPEPLQYEWTCKKSDDGKSASKVQVRCNYKVSKGVYNIDAGCYRTVDKAAFGCVKNGDALNLQSFQGDAPEKAAEAAGLRSC
jgi:hypothetical protein